MRNIAVVVLAISIAITLFSPIIWLLGLLAGIGGSLIHLFLILTPLGFLGVLAGGVLLIISGRNAKS